MKNAPMPLSSRSSFLASTAALTFAVGRPVRAQSPLPTLRVAAIPTEPYGEAWFGIELGLFQKAGLSIELHDITSSAAAAAAIVGGSLDLAGTTPLLIAGAVAKGVPLVAVAAGALSTVRAPNAIVVVSKASPVNQAKDLVGKTIGVYTLRQLSELALDAWLEKNGVEPSQVRVVEVSPSTMIPALGRGQIDAGLIVEPTLTAGLKSGEIRVLGNASVLISPRYVASVWFTSTQFAQRNPDLIARFTGVIYEVARWANAHHVESRPLVAKYTKLAPEEVKDTTPTEFAEQLRPSEIQPMLDAAARYNFIPRPVRAAEILPQTARG